METPARRIEIREENGRQVEYIVEKCDTCGKDWVQERVVRLPKQAYKEWQKYQHTKGTLLLCSWMMISMIITMFTTIYVLGQPIPPLASIPLALLISCLVFSPGYAVFIRIDAKRCEKIKEILKPYLDKEGNPDFFTVLPESEN